MNPAWLDILDLTWKGIGACFLTYALTLAAFNGAERLKRFFK